MPYVIVRGASVAKKGNFSRTKDVTTELANAKTGQHALAWRELVELGIAQSFSAEGATGESGRCRLVWPKGHTLGDVVGTRPGRRWPELGARQQHLCEGSQEGP